MSYLSFEESTYTKGKCVAKLIDASVTDIKIPSSYEGINVVEIRGCSLWFTPIEKIFIPRTVRYIGDCVFRNCSKLREVTFEAGSELEKLGCDVFQYDYLLTSIDIPSNLNTLIYDVNNYLMIDVNNLSCLSYLGSTDFSTAYIFSNSPEIHVSDSLYPKGKQFGKRDVIRDGKTCEPKKEISKIIDRGPVTSPSPNGWGTITSDHR